MGLAKSFLPLAVAAAFGCAASANETEPPRLALPVDCEMGALCTVQFYVDHAPGEEATDYRCGSLTYNGHAGTDIRVPDLIAMERGVPVVAAADGVVLRVRDGEPDVSVDERGRTALRGMLAGNAVVLGHGAGWETQYSHLKQGSITVVPDQRVRAGDRIGAIGLSGSTNFPHLEFTVRHEQEVVDPFVGPDPVPSGCQVSGASMWTDRAQASLGYRASGVLLAGFADRPPDRHAVRAGAHRGLELAASAPALVFWTDVYGVRAGDLYSLRIFDSRDRLVAELVRTSENDAAQRFDFAGKRTPEGGWKPGAYRGEYRLERTVDGEARTVARVTRTVTVR